MNIIKATNDQDPDMYLLDVRELEYLKRIAVHLVLDPRSVQAGEALEFIIKRLEPMVYVDEAPNP